MHDLVDVRSIEIASVLGLLAPSAFDAVSVTLTGVSVVAVGLINDRLHLEAAASRQ